MWSVRSSRDCLNQATEHFNNYNELEQSQDEKTEHGQHARIVSVGYERIDLHTKETGRR
jgi:hypothetical protein